LFRPAALLELLPAAARAIVIAADLRVLAAHGLDRGLAARQPVAVDARQVGLDLERQLVREARVLDFFQLAFLDLVGAQQVDRAHQGSGFRVPDFVPGAGTQVHAFPEAPAPGLGVDQALAVDLVLDVQRLEFLGRHLEGDQDFVHEAHDQVDDARLFLAVLPLGRGAFLAPDVRQPLGRHDGFRTDRDRGQVAMQRVHGHRAFRAAVGQQEVVEFVEFFVGEGLFELHGAVPEAFL
jgi:hypothetical protein